MKREYEKDEEHSNGVAWNILITKGEKKDKFFRTLRRIFPFFNFIIIKRIFEWGAFFLILKNPSLIH